ncbi:permease for cytosine/purines, uracil, thiamine, allantoin-domain-containing protein [Aspergillus egyptiacus]|nr:permease for cytosine/purines, uracil, thiamine, allantoin-domain-containing protein [Aspergillus egyptiacus]
MASKSPLITRVFSKLEVDRDTDVQVDIYVNKDTRPLPPARRPYGPWHFVGLWMVTGSFNVGGWTTGSSLISLGLNVWQAMLAIIIAHTFVGLLCVAGGHPGAKWHVGFPIWMKQNWGIWGQFVFSSPLYGPQQTPGGSMKVYDMVAFVLYFVLCLPLVWFSPENYKKPFMIASVTVGTTVLTLLIWSTVRADGAGALIHNPSRLAGVEPATGSALGWAFVSAITANIGSIATHMWSQSDYTRYARKQGDQVLAQLVMVPLGTIIVACIGIICTSCATTIYPEERELLWNPYDFLDAVRRHEDNRGARAGVAFASTAFMFSQFGMVVASNLVVAGIDLAALLPRWFTVRRGGYFTIAFVFILQPWSLLNSATNFLTVVGSFNIFLGPLMGIMYADYFLLRRTTMKLTDMYGSTPSSIYWYWRGWNWRAGVAWILGVWYLVPGLAQRAMAPGEIWAVWTRLYQLAWFLGCASSGLIYIALDWWWPMPQKLAVDDIDHFGTFGDRPELDGVCPLGEDKSGSPSVEEKTDNSLKV